MGKMIEPLGMSSVAAFFLAIYLCGSQWLVPLVLWVTDVQILDDGTEIVTIADCAFHEYKYTTEAEAQYFEKGDVCAVLVWTWGTVEDWEDVSKKLLQYT